MNKCMRFASVLFWKIDHNMETLTVFKSMGRRGGSVCRVLYGLSKLEMNEQVVTKKAGPRLKMSSLCHRADLMAALNRNRAEIWKNKSNRLCAIGWFIKRERSNRIRVK